MTRYRNKQGLVSAIMLEHQHLDANLALLTREELLLPGVVGCWSTKDLMVHLTAWEQLLIYWYDAGLHGKTPDPYPPGMSHNAINALNALFYERNRERSLIAALEEYQDSYAQGLKLVRDLTEEELFSPGIYPWTGRHSLADYVAANTCQHYYWAKMQLRRWLKQQEIIPV
jgi:hypothetical protein